MFLVGFVFLSGARVRRKAGRPQARHRDFAPPGDGVTRSGQNGAVPTRLSPATLPRLRLMPFGYSARNGAGPRNKCSAVCCNPVGMVSSGSGFSGTSYPGKAVSKPATPTGLRPGRGQRDATPLGLRDIPASTLVPRNPGLEAGIPLGFIVGASERHYGCSRRSATTRTYAMVGHPSPRPSPRSCLTGRGRRTRCSLRRFRHGLSQRLIAWEESKLLGRRS